MSGCGSDSRDLPQCQALVADLERDPQRLPAYHGELEAAVTWLMDRTFESTDPAEKTWLASLELRARGVLERFRKANAN